MVDTTSVMASLRIASASGLITFFSWISVSYTHLTLPTSFLV